jgi:hypothetical protein
VAKKLEKLENRDKGGLDSGQFNYFIFLAKTTEIDT